jgi:hypothetical protein
MDLSPFLHIQTQAEIRPYEQRESRESGSHHGSHPIHVPEMRAAAVSSGTMGDTDVFHVVYYVEPWKDSESEAIIQDVLIRAASFVKMAPPPAKSL